MRGDKLDRYRIRLEGIRFRARHGALRAERDLPRDFVVDLEVTLPPDALPKTDSLTNVFNYDRLSAIVVEEGTRCAYKLLETLARRIVDRVLGDTPAVDVAVRLAKLQPPTTASVERVVVELRASR